MSKGQTNRSSSTTRKRLTAKDQNTAAGSGWVSPDMLRRTAPLAPWLSGDKSSLPKAPPGRGKGEG